MATERNTVLIRVVVWMNLSEGNQRYKDHMLYHCTHCITKLIVSLYSLYSLYPCTHCIIIPIVSLYHYTNCIIVSLHSLHHCIIVLRTLMSNYQSLRGDSRGMRADAHRFLFLVSILKTTDLCISKCHGRCIISQCENSKYAKR